MSQEEQVKPMMRHARSPSFETKLVTGAIANRFADRVEVSFYNESAFYTGETLIPVEGSEGEYRTSGEVATSMIREHVVAISVNDVQLDALIELLQTIQSDRDSTSA
ncbi:hypothetical protein I6M56_06155 [Shewanella algae]|uniref:hypothetical protein n=1 Tax=Shewanella algae TaxID=38313 RepID=UPI001AAC6E3E|nr:hypothetical protein [Shewanella algae]MBO2678446.1 hypothetical protein [Shewanella algae]